MVLHNSYGSLEEENTDNFIKNEKQLRNFKKKLNKKERKTPLTEDLQKEITILKIQITEFETRNDPVNIKQNDFLKEQRKKTKESDDFLEKEYRKNKDRNTKRFEEQKRQKEQEEKIKNEQEEKIKKEKEEKRKKEQGAKREVEREKKMSDMDRIIHSHGLNKKDLPQDILEIVSCYSHKLWKKLSLIYHPDKYGKDIYSKLLNCLKDTFNNP